MSISPESVAKFFADNHLNLVVVTEDLVSRFSDDPSVPEAARFVSADVGKYFVTLGNVRSNFPLFSTPEDACEYVQSHIVDLILFVIFFNDTLRDE